MATPRDLVLLEQKYEVIPPPPKKKRGGGGETLKKKAKGLAFLKLAYPSLEGPSGTPCMSLPRVKGKLHN